MEESYRLVGMDFLQNALEGLISASNMGIRQLMVMPSFSTPHPHSRRIPPWTQMNHSKPYIGEGKVLETCGAFLDKKRMDDSGRPFEMYDVHRCLKDPRRVWNTREQSRSRVFSYAHSGLFHNILVG